ncbi:MAG: DUF402 domain-containing protein [Syntrophobacteraceae bacterium]
MAPRLKIRGIYSTALTKLALDSGFEVIDPSLKIKERFPLEFAAGAHDVLIQDRDDLQGIELKGEADRLTEVLAGLQAALLDIVIVGFGPTDEDGPLAVARIELPGASKEKLDETRASVVPTLRNHHRLKVINSAMLEAAESELAKDPARKAELERVLTKEAILLPLEKEGVARIEHIRPSGKSMRPRQGAIQTINENRIVFKRTFSRGRYDGLDLLIRKGDYGLTEIREGGWYIKHSYFSKEHLLIGEYFNINTPVEFYPFGARYVDLEVDVIRRAGEEAFVIDREKLDILSRRGCIGKGLESRVLFVAEQILRGLNRERAKR